MPFNIVGDVDQCVLESQTVLVPSGEECIENVGVGEYVLAATGKSRYGKRIVTAKSKHDGEFVVVTIQTSSGFTMRVTHNHQCFASIPNRSTHTRYRPNVHWVYVMYRRGFGYRVGVTKNPKHRLRGENADKMWLIKMCDTRAEAQYWEHVYASRYGFPRLTFEDHNTRRRGSYMNNEWIAKFFSEVDTERIARKFQDAEGFIFDTGAHIVQSGHDPRVVLYATMCASRNTKTPTHVLRLQTSNTHALDAIREIGLNLNSSKKGMCYRHHTSDVKSFQRLASDIQSATGCEVVVRTNFISSENMDNRRFSPHMMPAGNIVPGFFVPVLMNGEVILDEVVQVSKEEQWATVYDLEVDGVANFFVGGICVHNSLFRFTGAKPEIMSEKVEEYFPDLLTFKLFVNYRSTQAIIDEQRESIARNYSDLGGPYDQNLFKELKPRDDAPEGEPFSFAMFNFQEEEAEHVAQSIEILCETEGYEWGDFFIGARTNWQLAYIEGELVRLDIKYVNLGGGSFWDAKHIQDVMAYVRLAYYDENPDEDISTSKDFKHVMNIPSKWFESPIGEKKGEYVPHRFLSNDFFKEVGGDFGNLRNEMWRGGVRDLVDFVRDIQVRLNSTDEQHGGLGRAIEFVVNNAYVQWLADKEGLINTDEAENGKIEDLRTVADIASDFEDPTDFFAYVERMRQAARDAKNGDHTKYVVISTVHKLKGKERPVVFGIGLCETMMDPEPAGLLPHTYSLTAPPNYGVLPTGGKGRIEDERCVFFVLISRAKERVYLSGFRYFRDKIFMPSRFVREIGLAKESTNDLE